MLFRSRGLAHRGCPAAQEARRSRPSARAAARLPRLLPLPELAQLAAGAPAERRGRGHGPHGPLPALPLECVGQSHPGPVPPAPPPDPDPTTVVVGTMRRPRRPPPEPRRSDFKPPNFQRRRSSSTIRISRCSLQFLPASSLEQHNSHPPAHPRPGRLRELPQAVWEQRRSAIAAGRAHEEIDFLQMNDGSS